MRVPLASSGQRPWDGANLPTAHSPAPNQNHQPQRSLLRRQRTLLGVLPPAFPGGCPGPAVFISPNLSSLQAPSSCFFNSSSSKPEHALCPVNPASQQSFLFTPIVAGTIHKRALMLLFEPLMSFAITRDKGMQVFLLSEPPALKSLYFLRVRLLGQTSEPSGKNLTQEPTSGPKSLERGMKCRANTQGPCPTLCEGSGGSDSECVAIKYWVTSLPAPALPTVEYTAASFL